MLSASPCPLQCSLAGAPIARAIAVFAGETDVAIRHPQTVKITRLNFILQTLRTTSYHFCAMKNPIKSLARRDLLKLSPLALASTAVGHVAFAQAPPTPSAA